MKPTINLIQIILGVFLIIVILVQQKGAGLGSTFGGELAMYRTKRGAEKLLFRLTIVLAFLFILASLIGLVI
ncbi:MAG: preprotein translocase subunit SecG [Candidatus Daviesbacteria bacterium]|nr:preprotein translocase subunit SecG [Candidatus Daviesbacteria bacterium]